VTRLKKMMLEELQLRNYAQNTIRHYLRAVEDFARHFNCSPDRLGPRHIREYQAELFEKRKLSANSVGQHLAALRFFYIKTLRKAWSIAETPYPKKTRRLPTILSREEVAQLLHAARTPGERILLMTLYATGARNSEHFAANACYIPRHLARTRDRSYSTARGRQRSRLRSWKPDRMCLVQRARISVSK
jgi:integrase/recombinase XerD